MRAIVLIVFIVIGAVPASAQSIVSELRGGVAAQGFGGQGVDKEQGAAINVESVFRSPRFLSILLAPRPVVGATIAFDSDATSQIYAGLDWRFDLTDRFFVNGGVGGAVHNGETDTFDPVIDAGRVNNTTFLGCRALFRLSADVGFQLTDDVSASAYWAHLSNAGLCTDNEGLDNLGVRIGWQF
jgi:lipid A 3-O-deacylase